MADCNFPMCTRIAQKNGLCLNHRIYAESFPTAIIKEEMERKEKPKQKINPVSEKRKVLNRELAKIVKRIKKERPECEMRVPGVCSKVTTCVHHKAGRIGTLLLDEKYMMAACSNCNIHVENNHAQAVEMGLKVSRLSKDFS